MSPFDHYFKKLKYVGCEQNWTGIPKIHLTLFFHVLYVFNDLDNLCSFYMQITM